MAENDCSHPVQMHGLCAICGLDLTESDFFNSSASSLQSVDSPSLHILHTTPHIKVTAQEAQRIENENMRRLLSERKLSLVVDLDQTVLHATIDPSVSDWISDSNHPNNQYCQDIHRVILPDSPHMYYIKLRPGLIDFFRQISKLFELHIYTMGSRSYAHSIVKLFDPDGCLFHDRILSRDDSENDRMVVVIDDRSDVWPNCPNLVQVPAYSFFRGTGDIHNPSSTTVAEQISSVDQASAGISEKLESTVLNPNDDELKTIQTVLTRLHHSFFSEYEADAETLPDVKVILPSMKREIFDGFFLVFSGILNYHNPMEEQYMWRLCQEFGAICQLELDSSTTQLISNRNDTEKVFEAQERSISVVKLEWIFECIRKWQRLDAKDYLVVVNGSRRGKRLSSDRLSSNSGGKKLKSAVLDEEEEQELDLSLPPTRFTFDSQDLEEINQELAELEESSEEASEVAMYDLLNDSDLSFDSSSSSHDHDHGSGPDDYSNESAPSDDDEDLEGKDGEDEKEFL